MTEKIEDFIPMQACRKRVPQFLPDQLTLSEPREVHYPHPVLHAPLDFQTLRRPCHLGYLTTRFKNNYLRSKLKVLYFSKLIFLNIFETSGSSCN